MDFDHFLHYLAKEGFADQEVDIVNGVMYPSTEMIISIHNFLIKYFKDQNDQIQSGIHSEGNIEFGLLHIKEQVSSNINQNENLLVKAAHLMNILFTAHAFVDGNKRTGFVTFLLFLAINLYPSHLDLENYPDHVSFFKKMASRNTKDEHNVPEIMAWFKKNVA